jgi:hypothetical protein
MIKRIISMVSYDNGHAKEFHALLDINFSDVEYLRT